MVLSDKNATGLIYLVKLDTGGRWNISRDGKPAGGFTLDKGTSHVHEGAMRPFSASP